MSDSATETRQFAHLLNELDVRAKQAGFHAEDASRRRRPRYTFRAPCCVRFMPLGSTQLTEWPGRTRNLSRSGLALLVRRAFSLGDAVEIELKLANHPGMFMAGFVTFCRYAGGGYHEVGVGLRLAAHEPIFSANLTEMTQTLGILKQKTGATEQPATTVAVGF